MRFSGYCCALLAAALLLPSCTRPFWRKGAEPRVAEFLLGGETGSQASALSPNRASGGVARSAPVEDGTVSSPQSPDKAPGAATPPSPEPKAVDPSAAPQPTPAQQAAARALLNQQPASNAVPEAASILPDDMPYLPQGQLRTISPVPPEEAASSAEQNVPPPNAVERRGLRSPSLPKVLPMDINGRVSGRSGR